jgi:predicted DNA-binding transcriptional regulator AlpA
MKSLNIIRPAELAKILSVSTATLWRMERRNELPPRKQISRRVVGWVESDLIQWLKERPNAEITPELEESEK